jgi:hypothetical protein
MWYMLQDRQRYLYHYTSLETALGHIIPSKSLQFSRLGQLNDPREYRDWSFDFGTTEGRDLGETFDIPRIANSWIRSRVAVACLSRDVTDLRDTKDDFARNGYERGHSRPRMWAQYANNYRGVCLIFERSALSQAIQRFAKQHHLSLKQGEVVYRNRKPVRSFFASDCMLIDYDRYSRAGAESYMRWHLSQFFDELILTKQEDWADEREYRFALVGNLPDTVRVPLAQSLVGAALGDKSDSKIDDLRKACWGSGMSLAIMSWQNGFPQPQVTYERPAETPTDGA